MSMHAGEGVRRLAIQGEMGIYGAAERTRDLLAQLAACAELELDLSGVEEMDSAGLQVLLVVKAEAQATGKPLRLLNHSRAVFEVLELLRMQDHFGDPVVIPADWRTR